MKKSSFNYNELISCANGELFGPGNAKLPSPPMLMFDRITEISEKNGNIPILHPTRRTVKIRVLCAPSLAFKFALLSWPKAQCV